MHIELTKSMFRDMFASMGRKDQFSYEALGEIFDHYKDLEFQTGEFVEVDVIGLCCTWVEMGEDELIASYGEESGFNDEGSATIDDLVEYVQDRTIVYDLSNGNYLLQSF